MIDGYVDEIPLKGLGFWIYLIEEEVTTGFNLYSLLLSGGRTMEKNGRLSLSSSTTIIFLWQVEGTPLVPGLGAFTGRLESKITQ